jgi:predicted Zn finger-like uncharacterized protein
MIRLTCPACAATYDVPEAAIGPAGRQMRCSRCGHEWLGTRPEPPPREEAQLPKPAPEPPMPEPSAPAPADIAADLADRLAPAAVPTSPRASPALVGAWAASLALVLGGAALAWSQREPLVAAWPPLARLTAWLGA